MCETADLARSEESVRGVVLVGVRAVLKYSLWTCAEQDILRCSLHYGSSQ